MGSSPKKLRLGTGEGDPAAASSKGKEKAPTVDDLLSEGDPAAASSKGEEKAPSLDDMLSDASSDGSGRASREFSSVSEARDFQDADLAPPLSKRSEVGEENAKSWKFTTTQLADQLELEGGKRDKFRKLLANQRRSQKSWPRARRAQQLHWPLWRQPTTKANSGSATWWTQISSDGSKDLTMAVARTRELGPYLARSGLPSARLGNWIAREKGPKPEGVWMPLLVSLWQPSLTSGRLCNLGPGSTCRLRAPASGYA